jgi:lysophospholipase L1-like esterase
MSLALRRAIIGSTAASVLVVAVGAGAAASPPVSGSPIVRPVYQWSMPDRFGLDQDHDGLIDLPNTEEYTHNRAPGSCPAGCMEALFDVLLDASASTATLGGESLPIVSYRWSVGIEGRSDTLEYTRAGPALPLLLPEGDHTVTLTVTARLPWGTTSGRVSGRLEVEDVLIVALGDSYASGEGNPEIRRGSSVEAAWGDGAGDHLSEAAHAEAHRSSLAWPVQAALVLERSDSRSSVTFLTLAESGATVDDGLAAGGPAGSQVDRAARLVGERDVDMVLLSIGGNDIGFSQLIRGLVDADRLFDPFCYSVDLANVWASVEDGDWNRDSALDYRLERPWELGCRSVRRGDAPLLPGLSGLPDALDRAAAALDAALEPRVVYLTEYPDPSGLQRDGETALCGEIVGDTTPPFRFHEIDRAEQEEGRIRALEPLNRILHESSARHGWIYVDGIAEAFRDGHGYCAEWPDYGYPDDYTSRPGFLTSRLDHPEGWYRNPGVDGVTVPAFEASTSWYRSAAQSAVLQGPDTRYATAGTLHPNELGHRAIAEIVLDAMGGLP